MKEELNYQEFFKEEIYDKFTKYLLGKYGSAACIAQLNDEPLFTKKGVHVSFRRAFNAFLNENPKIEKVFAEYGGKTFVLKNIAGEMLHFPVDVNDEALMIREELRSGVILPKMDHTEIPRASKQIKNTTSALTQKIMRQWNQNERDFLVPMNLTLHFKRGYAMSIHKTTMTFKVTNPEQVRNLIFDAYEGKVAYAIFDKERLTFVRNGNPNKNKSKEKVVRG